MKHFDLALMTLYTLHFPTPQNALLRTQSQFVREQIAIPLGLEDSFFLGGLSARGVEPSRIAHVEHTFKAPGGRSASVSGHEEEKESAAAGQPTQQATTGSRSGGRGRESSRATSSSVGRGHESTRASSALVGREPSAESKQSVADEDEVVIGIEDIDEVRKAGGQHDRCAGLIKHSNDCSRCA